MSWIPTLWRRRQRDALLAQAATWPYVEARLLNSAIVAKDALAEGGTAFQEQQIESQFYFTLPGRVDGSYFGGHLRSTPVSDSEGHRLIRALAEDAPVNIRYDPHNPDRTCAFPADNPGFTFTIYPG